METAIYYIGGFIMWGIIGFGGSGLIIALYEGNRSFEWDKERRQQDFDAAGRVSMRVGLFAGGAWVVYWFFHSK